MPCILLTSILLILAAATIGTAAPVPIPITTTIGPDGLVVAAGIITSPIDKILEDAGYQRVAPPALWKAGELLDQTPTSMPPPSQASEATEEVLEGGGGLVAAAGELSRNRKIAELKGQLSRLLCSMVRKN